MIASYTSTGLWSSLFQLKASLTTSQCCRALRLSKVTTLWNQKYPDVGSNYNLQNNLNIKVLGELCELKIKALLPTLTLGLSLVKVFCMLSCDWPRYQQGTSKIMIAASIMIFTVANLYFYFLHPKNTSFFTKQPFHFKIRNIFKRTLHIQGSFALKPKIAR